MLSLSVETIKSISDGSNTGRSRDEPPVPRASHAGRRSSHTRRRTLNGPVPIFDRMSQSIESKKALSKRNLMGGLGGKSPHVSRQRSMDLTLLGGRKKLLTKSAKSFSEPLATMMEGPDEGRESEAGSLTKSSAPTAAAAADIDEPMDHLTRREEAPTPVIDVPSEHWGKLLKEENACGISTTTMEGRAPLPVTSQTSGDSPDHKAGRFSEKELMEAEFILQHFQIFGAMLVLEVFGGAGAVWGFSQVLTLRDPATVWFWRPAALAFGVLFFIRWMKEIYDYYAEEDLGFFGGGALHDDEKGYGSSTTHQWNESSGFSDDDPEILDHEEACKNSKTNVTMGSDKTKETENEENSLIGSQVAFGDIVERPMSSKYIDWGHEPSEKPNELYWIFGAKLVLEVFGGPGAIWGFSNILTLHNATTDWLWRPITLAVAAVFLVRWIMQIRDYLAEDSTAEIDPRTRLYQIFGAKLVLEVFGGAGAIWGFSEALTLRDGTNAWFWRPVALIFGVIFFVRWGLQIREYCAEENIEMLEDEAALVQEGEQTPLLPTKARGA